MRRAPAALGTRLALVLALVLVAFLGLAGLALEDAFRRSVEEGLRERLQVRVYLLLGAAEIDAEGRLVMPSDLAEPRLATPDSGLYAAIRTADGERVWQSESALGRSIAWPAAGAVDGPVHRRIETAEGERLHALRHPVTWEIDGRSRRYVFLVAESAEGAAARIAAFRRTVWGWFAAIGGLLLLSQSIALRWGLRPLRRAAAEVADIERGERERLGADFPRELRPLTLSVNELLQGNASRLQRYREALSDLAHSLKNPLAVLRSIGADPALGERAGQVREQVERMQQAIAWHVQRGAAAGRGGLARSIPVAETVGRIAASLEKVYAARAVSLEQRVPGDACFRGDPDDFMEIAGNLLDNAWKWCAGQVRVTATGEAAGGLRLTIEDDGPGIPAGRRAEVLERGVRFDQTVPGDGIGLALVRRMVEEAYGGTLDLDAGELGGLRVTVRLPGGRELPRTPR